MAEEQNANLKSTCSMCSENIPKVSKSDTDQLQLVTVPDKEFPGVELSYINGVVNSLEVKSPQTPEALSVIFTENSSIESATFNSGVLKGPQRLDFHNRIPLSKLQTLTITIPNLETTATSKATRTEFKRLFHFLKEIEYEKLETLEITCPAEWIVHVPWASAIIPSYEYEDSHPLTELIRLNKEMIKNISFGPTSNQMYLKLNPVACTKMCEPKNYPQLEIFQGFPNIFSLPSLSAILKPQKHLTKLAIAFTHVEVWQDVSAAIKSSCETLEIIDIKAFAGERAIIDMETFRNCYKLTRFSFKYIEFDILRWGSLPRNINVLTIGGPITHNDAKEIVTSLTFLREAYFDIKPAYYKNGVAQPLDIVLHPFFEFMKAAPETLREFSVKYHDLLINWRPLEEWTNSQTKFKLTKTSNMEFSLIDETPVSTASGTSEEILARNISATSEISPMTEEDAPDEENSSFYATCMGVLSWRDRYTHF